MGIRMLVGAVRKAVLSGKERSVKAKKNILGSLGVRIGSIAISFLMVPMTIDYVNPTRYGIWLTLSTIVAWFGFFDIGLTNGLRNKLAEAKAMGDELTARKYVSTTYAILGMVFFSVWLVYLIVHGFLDWSRILNVEPAMRDEVGALAMIVFTYFCLQFVLKIVNTILVADQLPAKASMIDLASQLFSLIVVAILVIATEGSLVKLGLALCVCPIVVYLVSNYFFFSRDYKMYRPSAAMVDFKYSKGLLNLGAKFFVIQIAALIQFQTANFIIAQQFGAYEVTSYNIVYKYFNILGMGFGILLAPFWTASTEAYFQKDISWIKNSVKKYLAVLILVVLFGVGMLLFSETFYRIWLKGQVEIDFMLSLSGFVFFSFYLFGSIFVNFLNGISALRIQFWVSLFSPIVFIAAAYLMIEYFHFGVASLFIASLIAGFNGWLIAPFQYYLIIYKNKLGIWVR